MLGAVPKFNATQRVPTGMRETRREHERNPGIGMGQRRIGYVERRLAAVALLTTLSVLLVTGAAIDPPSAGNLDREGGGVTVINVPPQFSGFRIRTQDGLNYIDVVVSDYNSWSDIFRVEVAIENDLQAPIADVTFQQYPDNATLPLGAWFHEFLHPRYVSLVISIFLAMYVGLEFILVVFNAADVGERWSFELTPFATLNLPDVQLAFLSGVASVSNAFLHYSVQRTHRKWAILLTGSMVAGLLLALRGATADLDPVNLGRVAALVLLLALVPLDNADLLRLGREAPEDFIEAELRSIGRAQAEAGPVNPAGVTRALRDLEAIVAGLPETTPLPAPSEASVGTADDEYLRELMTSVVGESEEDEEDRKSTRLNSSHRCMSYAVFCLKKTNE